MGTRNERGGPGAKTSARGTKIFVVGCGNECAAYQNLYVSRFFFKKSQHKLLKKNCLESNFKFESSNYKV
jgi:hypothetical protein